MIRPGRRIADISLLSTFTRYWRPPRQTQPNGAGNGHVPGRRRGRPARRPRRRRLIAAAAIACALCLFAGVSFYAWNTLRGPGSAPPPANGYFRLLPVGSFASLPGDAQAAAEVHRSTWEIRPGNTGYDNTIPKGLSLERVTVANRSYDPRWNKYIIGRIDGDFTGTTDEIFQWAAAKWGLPDNLLRAVAVVESHWYQTEYGDFIENSADCPPGYRAPCPVTFGIVGTRSTSWPGIFPWNRLSTAAAVDVLGAWLRGCYEGWVWWLRDHGNKSRGVYHAGDLWGCIGSWYSGNWHDGSPGGGFTGENYIQLVQHWYAVRPWLQRGF